MVCGVAMLYQTGIEFINILDEILSVQQEKSGVQKNSRACQTPDVQQQCAVLHNCSTHAQLMHTSCWLSEAEFKMKADTLQKGLSVRLHA